MHHRRASTGGGDTSLMPVLRDKMLVEESSRVVEAWLTVPLRPHYGEYGCGPAS